MVGTERDGPKRFHGNIGSVWTSEDGRIWHRTARGVGPYLVHVIEHDRRLYALSGGVHRRTPAAMWTSEDAVEWERVHTSPDGGGLEVIASDGQTIVAGSTENMAYSTDGRPWVEAPIEQVGACHCWLEDATAFSGGFLAVGAHSDRGAAWHSVDGRSWSAVEETVDTGAYITHLNGVALLPTGGVLVTAGTDEYAGRLYHWDDGETWGEPVFGVDGVGVDNAEMPFSDVAILDGRALIVGYQPDEPRGFSAAAWTTPAPEAEATPGSAVAVCPGPRPSIDELVLVDPAVRQDCFGEQELTFRAWLAPHQYPDLEYFGQPLWLTAGVGGRRALPVEGNPGATMSLVVHVRPRDGRRLDVPVGRWAIVRGHFDDRAARKCPEPWEERCRQAFVVSDVGPIRRR